jgi:hypothetical protein
MSGAPSRTPVHLQQCFADRVKPNQMLDHGICFSKLANKL